MSDGVWWRQRKSKGGGWLFSKPKERKSWRFGPELSDIWLINQGDKSENVKTELLGLVDRLHAQESLEQGKAAFLEGQNEYAISLFSAAIALERKGVSGTLPELYSNRSSAFLALRMVDEAVEDAQTYLDIRSEKWELLEAERKRQQAAPRVSGINLYKRAKDFGPASCSKWCWGDSSTLVGSYLYTSTLYTEGEEDEEDDEDDGVRNKGGGRDRIDSVDARDRIDSVDADSGDEQHNQSQQQSAIVRQRVRIRQAVKELHRDFFADREIQIILKGLACCVQTMLLLSTVLLLIGVIVYTIQAKAAERAQLAIASHGTVRGAHLQQIMQEGVPSD
jgi:hypothetical protein